MQLQNIDLNLYVVFDRIYREGHITRAAQNLRLTQPAVSHALRRLRELYQDQLFVRRGTRMEPTALARSMRPLVQKALEQLQDTLQQPTAFDASSSRYTFVLGMRDLVEGLVLPPLMYILQIEAPLTQLSSVRIARREMEAELNAGRLVLAFDVLLPIGTSIRHQSLLEDRFVVVARRNHPALLDGLSLESYLNARHLVVSSRRSGPAVEDFELARIGFRRQVAMRCQHIFVALKALACTDFLLTLPESFARQNALTHGLSISPLPMALPMLTVHMYWHAQTEEEPSLVWLREQIIRCARQEQAEAIGLNPDLLH